MEKEKKKKKKESEGEGEGEEEEERVVIYLGTYKTPEDAAQAYNAAAVKYFGEFAQLNVIPKKD